jgi:uncharacterized protein
LKRDDTHSLPKHPLRASVCLMAIAFPALIAAGGCLPRPGPAIPKFALPWGHEVILEHDDGTTLRAWFRNGRPGGGAVLILHGLGADHRDMIPRALALTEAGYATLLLDFRGHGRSTESETTWGLRESEDASAALAWLRESSPDERVGVIGVSMGGAAALLGSAPLKADAIVLESVYPTLDDAIRNRMATWLGPIGALAAPLFKHVVASVRGVSLAALRPIDRIEDVTVPLLVAAGTHDPYTPIGEARALFERAPKGRKQFWSVKGAGHHDLYLSAPSEYLGVVGGFLANALRAGPVGPGNK